MKRPQWIRLANYLLYLSFCLLAGTGFLLEWRLPRGRSYRGLELWGLDRHDWGEIHLWVGLVFVTLIVIHLLMHLKWLWQVAVRKRPLTMILSLSLGLIAIAALLLWPIKDSSSAGGRGQGGKHSEHRS